MQVITNHSQGGVTSTGIPDPLDLLSRQAQAQENADKAETLDGAALPGEAPAETSMGNAACVAMVFEMMRGALVTMANCKSPLVTLSDEKIKPAAEALGAVADKYGIQLAGVAGDYMVELKAAVIVVPMVWAFRGGLVLEIEADKAHRKALANESQAENPSLAPLSDTVIHAVG